MGEYATVLYAVVMLGTLIPTFVVSRLLLWLMRRWNGGTRRIAMAHIVSWLTCSLGITGIEMTVVQGAAFTSEGFATFAFAQVAWFLFDIVRWLSAPAQAEHRCP